MVCEAIRLYELKKKVAKDLESILPRESLLKARRDPHARRNPRPCGITVHPGHGCPLGCLYCYIYDMGFTKRVTPYPLNSLELVYALAVNPYVVPTKTLVAVGSVTEPFLPQITGRSISYIRDITKYLQLPVQVSTKMIISGELARRLSFVHPQLSILISVTSLRCGVLEPHAPPPKLRIFGGKEAARHGLRVDLFLRPIIPGLTEGEVPEILRLAKINGFKGVVAGSLRITERILKNLGDIGIDVKELIKRSGRVPATRGRQVPIKSSDIKLIVRATAQKEGLEYMQSACAANILAHEMSCWLCKFGPCGRKLRVPSEEELLEFFEYLNFKVDLSIKGTRVKVGIREIRARKKNINWLRRFLEDVYRVPFVIKFI